jgi:hypothetical protein
MVWKPLINNLYLLTQYSVENTLALILPPEGEDADSTALQQIIALIRRSDSVPVKSEGTRVLVHAIKSVWSSDASAGARRQEAMITLLTPQTAEALAQLIGRSKKYPILINEGVIALTLLSTYMKGGTSCGSFRLLESSRAYRHSCI